MCRQGIFLWHCRNRQLLGHIQVRGWRGTPGLTAAFQASQSMPGIQQTFGISWSLCECWGNVLCCAMVKERNNSTNTADPSCSSLRVFLYIWPLLPVEPFTRMFWFVLLFPIWKHFEKNVNGTSLPLPSVLSGTFWCSGLGGASFGCSPEVFGGSLEVFLAVQLLASIPLGCVAAFRLAFQVTCWVV